MFSEREERIIKIVGRKKLTLDEISEKLFKNEPTPFDANILVGNSIRRIIKKCSYNNLKWTFEKNRNERKLTIKKVKV